ncbi:MAG: YicC/YloC family endoribonuclease [Saprospiraceae bacterium]
MILSMTGFGRASRPFGDSHISVEIRSLNSKSTDIKMRLPQRYRSQEMELRKQIKKSAERGKVDMVIELTTESGGELYSINEKLFATYYKQLAKLQGELGIPQGDFLSAIMRIQGVVDVPKGGLSEEEQNALGEAVTEALEQLQSFRLSEGNAMKEDLEARVAGIEQAMEDITPFEEGRIVNVKQRIQQQLDKFIAKDKVDENRFEQEVIYYLEKMDINEERVRLKQHCKYFIEQMSKGGKQKGRKLAFIGQEMGREINTLGSKAHSSDIQKLVVKMKDELEKIKEQSANIL